MSFTEGPWAYRRHTDDDCAEIATVAIVEDYVVGVEYESKYQTNYDFHGSAEADARLIAAAPELLSALMWAMPRLQEVGGEDNPEYVKAMAAIQKATS
jgi:hypothetical protein